MASRPPDARLTQAEIVAIARAHSLCLPETASSRAGLGVLERLYAALACDEASRVLWYPASSPAHYGAFAAGTLRYRETEAHTRRSLPRTSFARLAIRVAAMPGHVLARRRWENTIPHAGIGYVLTLGAARAVLPGASTERGSAVLSELEAWFVARGAQASWVDTELSNERAHRFYLRMGYFEVARDYGQVLLRKPLSLTATLTSG